MDTVFCPICENADAEVHGRYRSTDPTFVGLQRAHCRHCGMVFATPMPSEADLDAYNKSYFNSAHGGQAQSITATFFFSAIAKLRSAYLELYLCKHKINVESVLEGGPGPGFFARNWLKSHPQTDYMAIEPDLSCHASLQQAGVILVNSADFTKGNQSVDLVVMSHVLEHVPNPRKFLIDATRNLRKGGVLFIEVPCRDWEHKPLDEPHLLFFDKQPMQHLLNKLGFDDIQVSYHGQEIDQLRSAPPLRAKYLGLRSKLISLGLISPFAKIRQGMEVLTNPFERAAVAPFLAHRETLNPAWWLRALAIKKL